VNRKDNPYSPGAGRKPVALVGRDVQLETWEGELNRIENGLDSRPLALYGLRGIGKTVLLSRMHETASGRGWFSARIEADAGKNLRESIGSAFDSKLTELAAPNAGEKILRALKTALSFNASIDMPGGYSFGIDLSGIAAPDASTGMLRMDIENYMKVLSDASEELGVGVALLIDEAQELSLDDFSASG
jgi:AAA+ ATPase superfamily predicted ATPase